ncbi:uncharacterized protein SPPG_08856 [Spizellomyces punctatus DAOM BR117]|uniref:Apoptogenic protein 1, mitochondrial n=1 Tax=Spizellomyces punctatus (strain DAOM BR117) TaxID=645134 RepID=A0A0L0HUU4_SPIPD|nr:uncharacterized protein SPPG_08856 [Spizellomyces punctatus DAOM BR117]KND04898.1 hypothetical protein SPPG_08856 [Spizellomyces punctatus DAOM BR117]|eukprot:XP_016612937.1 hypothetical protein SPPG_08856 [Spizellomyces punctatus DAOM BR117]
MYSVRSLRPLDRCASRCCLLIPLERRAIQISSSAQANRPKSSPTPHPSSSLLVSSPHPVSHIRLLRFKEEIDSLPDVERSWQRHREHVQQWHHEFWESNNKHFQDAKLSFELEIRKTHDRLPTSTELSSFYKEYLNASYERHARYNSDWWKENTQMLIPAFRAEMSALMRSAGTTMMALDAWWQRMGHAIVRVGGGYRAQGVTMR